MLSPYRVLDLTTGGAMICGQMLADLGADVIAIEPPGGSPSRAVGPYQGDHVDPAGSLFWQSYSRNKRSVMLDLESAEGREQFKKLAETADFVIESFAPGHLDRLGVGYQALSAAHPGLILVSITPFGQEGPKARWPASDLTVLASSGALLLTGDDDRPPVRVAVPQAFLHAGAEAATGALLALQARERDGLGQHVDVSAQTAAMMATQSFVLQAGWGENPLGRMAGGIKLGPIHLRIIYPCKDGYVSVTFLFGTALGPFSRRLMEVMCEEGFVDEATRDKDWLNYTVLLLSGQEPISEFFREMDAIEQFTRAHTKAQLFERAMERGLLIVPVSTTADVVQSEQLASRDYWRKLNGITYPGPFAKFTATPIEYRRPAPAPGEHTNEVLSEVRSQKSEMSTAGFGLRTSDSGLPLAGVKVLDFTWVMVGPMGVRYLADYGATVVHVESGTRVDTARTIQPFKDAQSGPERSGLYSNVNAGKLGLTLNLSKPEARELALKLARWADVVVESYSPKAMRAWGLDYEAIRSVNPSVIMMSSCLNGHSGPHAGLAGFGTMGAVLAGFGEVAGWPDRPPAGPFGAYTDYVAPKFIASSLLAALDHRRRTGEGQYIDLSQAEASIHFLTPAILDYTVNGRVQSRAGNTSAEHAPHGVYPVAGEDRWVAIACATEEQWRSLCRAAGHDDWASDPRFAAFARQQHHEALDTLIAEWTASREAGELEELLARAGVPVHRVSASTDAFADPQLQHRGHFIEVEHPELGRVPLESARARLSRTPARVPTPGPTFGQHNDMVLRELLGLSDEEIVDLTIAGALE